MKNYIIFSLLLIPCVTGGAKNQDHKKINLEDIERDNIISEQKSSGKDKLQTQQTQHLRPPGIQSVSKYQLHNNIDSLGSNGPGGVIYATPSSPQQESSHSSSHQQYLHSIEEGDGPGSQVQYVTIAPSQYDDYGAAKVYVAPAVHESTRTYSAPSRQSLVKPIAPTIASYIHQQEQPRFVYIQQSTQEPETINGQHLSVSEQHNDNYESIGQQQESVEQTYQQPGTTNLQYVPYIASGPSHSQSYVMMVPIPAGYSKQLSITPSILSYTHSTPALLTSLIPQHQTHHHHHQAVQYITPSVDSQPAVQYVSSNELQSPPEDHNHDERTHLQAGDIQYAIPNHGSQQSTLIEKSKQLQYAPQHPEQPQEHIAPEHQQQLAKLQYLATQKVIPLHNTQQVPQFVQPIQYSSAPAVDIFGSFNRQSKSLLDSYVPSWVILMKQRALGNQQYAQQYTPNGPAYNTIAYSSPQALPPPQYIGSHYKRSAKVKA